jgi:glycosyl transferase family 25
MWDFLDKVVYINLDKRTDRRTHMEGVTATFGNKVHRFAAIEGGSIGCTKSHVAVLRQAMEENVSNILILEDDVEWTQFESGYAQLESLVSNPYDVIMLGAGSLVQGDAPNRVYTAQCAHAYIVNKHYIPILLQTFEDGLQCLIASPAQEYLYAHDQYWKNLQPFHKWYIVLPFLMYQRPDYSDIQKQYVDYRG